MHAEHTPQPLGHRRSVRGFSRRLTADARLLALVAAQKREGGSGGWPVKGDSNRFLEIRVFPKVTLLLVGFFNFSDLATIV